jgi:chemotaxis protein CheC
MDDREIDAFSEIANLGTGHAISALSDMLQRRLDMEIPKVEFISIERAVELVGKDKIIVGVFLRIEGEIPNNFLVMIPRESALHLVDLLLGKKPGDTVIFSDIDQSVILEVGNILACAYMTALSDFMGMNLKPSPPSMVYDMASAVIEFVMLEFGDDSEHAMVFHCKAGQNEKDVNLHLLMIPSNDSLKDLRSRIRGIMGME